jgi:murein L,D-transpeptidase YafK
MKIFFLILMGFLLQADDILTSYRKNGISNIEKEMDYALMQKKYWDDLLKDEDTSFGYIKSYKNILICDKNKSTLNLYSLDDNKKYKFKKEYSAYTGKFKGDKYKEGDLKTPIGIYNLTKKLEKVDNFYGPMAFVTSYPNTYDKYRGRGGHGIWIHGLPTNKQKRDKFTKGCIAINNTNIECLDKNIDINKTLLIINTSSSEETLEKTTLAKILAQLYEWRYAWKYNYINTYLSFYDKNFVKHDGMSYEKFLNYKKRVFNRIEKRTIIFNDINVIRYPNTIDTFQITFKEFYKSDTFKFTGNKVLIVKLDQSAKFKILTEK